MPTSTGYGPRTSRPFFDGNEERCELWEVKFVGYLRLQKLHDTILQPGEGGLAADKLDAGKNAEAFAELTLSIDDRSLSLVLRDAKDDGRKALKILRTHYLSSSETRVIGLYTELTSLKKAEDESLTDYLLRGETVSNNLLIAMILKDLPAEFKSFVTVTTHRKEPHDLASFKTALRTHEETMRACGDLSDNIMFVKDNKTGIRCYGCGEIGHKKPECTAKKNAARGHQKRWCNYCKTTNHDTKFCRKKMKEHNAKSVTSDEGHTFAFKVTVESEDCEFVHDVNSLLVDTGATTHIVNNKTMFSSFQKDFDPAKHYIELADGSHMNKSAEGRGQAKIDLKDSQGTVRQTVLENALYVPSFKQNIFSVQCATNRGSTVKFKENTAELKCKDGTIFKTEKQGHLYFLNSAVSSKKASHSLREWHEILGHCNVKDVLKLENVVDGMNITDKSFVNCDVCIKGKMSDERSRMPDAKAKAPLQFVHCDLAGPIEQTAREGFKYALCFTDDFSSLITMYFLKNKSDTVKATKKCLADVAPYGCVKRLRSDNGGEFISKEFKELMLDSKIKHETSAPRSPHQNGSAERQWRTVFEMARCMLIESGLPKYLWTYAVMSAAYIRNRCYNPRITKTSFEAFTGIRPNVSNMHFFGTQCFAYVDEKKKLDARSEEGVFVGYDRESPAFLVYFSMENKIKRVRCVKFTEKKLVSEQNEESVPIRYNDVSVDVDLVIKMLKQFIICRHMY